MLGCLICLTEGIAGSIHEDAFIDSLRSQINSYIALNVASAPSAGVAWEGLQKGAVKQKEHENKI